jgi:hypothetical protein
MRSRVGAYLRGGVMVPRNPFRLLEIPVNRRVGWQSNRQSTRTVRRDRGFGRTMADETMVAENCGVDVATG